MTQQISASPSARALRAMAERGSLLHPASAKDVPSGEFVYLVSNGPNVLQLGKGDQDRVRKCTRGGLAGKHNKAFICAVGEVVLGQPNNYALLRVPSKDDADSIEGELHASMGIARNKDGATLIDGIDARSIVGIHEALWARAKTTNAFRGLDACEQLMAEEMFELVTFATSRVLRRSGRVIASRQADNLEGNILMNLRRRHVANVFVKLTGGYLRYGPTHLLSDEDFERAKANYTYAPRRTSFDVSNVD